MNRRPYSPLVRGLVVLAMACSSSCSDKQGETEPSEDLDSGRSSRLAEQIEILSRASRLSLWALDVNDDGIEELVLATAGGDESASPRWLAFGGGDESAAAMVLASDEPADDGLLDRLRDKSDDAEHLLTFDTENVRDELQWVFDTADELACDHAAAALALLGGLVAARVGVQIAAQYWVRRALHSLFRVASNDIRDAELTFEQCVDDKQKARACFAIQSVPVIDFICSGPPEERSKACDLFATREHCYQVMHAGAGVECREEPPRIELCRPDEHASGCCNQKFIFETVLKSDLNNAAPLARDPRSGRIDDGMQVYLGGPQTGDGVTADIIDFSELEPLAGGLESSGSILGCVIQDVYDFAMDSNNPIRITFHGDQCVRNTTERAHILQGYVETCVHGSSDEVYSTIEGRESPGEPSRFAGINEELGPFMLGTARDHFRRRVQQALAAVDQCGLTCNGDQVNGGSVKIRDSGGLDVSSDVDECDVVVPACGDNECSPEESADDCPEDCSDVTPGADAGAGSHADAGVDEGPPELQDYPDAPAVPVTPAQVSGKGLANGDPHLRTFDGYRYDPQPVGELTLVRDPTDDFEVQVRTAPWRKSKSVSVHVAVAVRAGTDRFALYLQEGTRLNGESVEIEIGETHLPGGATLTRTGNKYTLAISDGTLVTLIDRGNHINVSVILAAARAGRVMGLLGDRDRRTRNDITTRDGEELGRRLSFEEFYGEFIESWRIQQSDSLFDYPEGMGTEDFTDRNFPRRRAHYSDLNPSEAEPARQTCEAAGVSRDEWLEACAVDLVLTGDAQFAEGFVGLPAAAEALQVDPPLDEDGDGVRDGVDNCPATPNATQRDVDEDALGDACDDDIDADDIENTVDVCPSVADPEQLDSDNDGIGDACEAAPDAPESDGSTLTLTVSPGGSVSVAGVDTCTAATSPCSYDLDELLAFFDGPAVTLTAVPDADYTLDRWSGDCTGTDLEFAVASSGAVNCGASFFGTEGSVELIEPPPSVVPQDTEDNDLIVFFREHQDLSVTEDVPIDMHVATAYTNNADTPAFIPAGTTVDVYFFHFDPVASQSVSRSATLFVPGEILGIATRTATLEATDEMFALSDTLYPEPGADPAREFELSGGDSLELLPNRRTVNVSMTTSTSADQFRLFVLSSGHSAPLIHSESIAWVDGSTPDFNLGALELAGAASVYDEGVTAVSDLPIDVSTPGNYANVTTAPAGSLPTGDVRSYYVHFDPLSSSTVVGTITFPTPILGIQTTSASLDASDELLGVSGASYPTGESTRGADSNDALLWSEDTRSVRWRLQVTSGMDEMRVLVSEP